MTNKPVKPVLKIRSLMALLLLTGLLAASCSRNTSGNSNYANSRGYSSQQTGKRKKVDFENRANTTKPKSARQLRREERMKKKPQYSDPMYFGHKKPPKKRPPGKQKFCKVCGMRH